MFIWTIGDAIAVVVGGCMLLVFMGMGAWTAVRQRFCKHDGGVRETSACDAICSQCGKNLGFIGTWRAIKEGTNAN